MSHLYPTGTPVTRLRHAILLDIHDAEGVAREALQELGLTPGDPSAPKVMQRIRAALLHNERNDERTVENLRIAISDLLS